MYNPFRRARTPAAVKTPVRAALRLEQLEDRLTPAAPVITSFLAQHIGNQVMISGFFTDETPDTASVTLSGTVSTTLTPMGGMFYYVGSYTSGGSVTATVTDEEALTASTSGSIQEPNPNVSVTISNVSYGAGRQVTITGSVSDSNVQGRAVVFTGAATGSTTCNANGEFSATLTASTLGTVTATVYDSVGQYSDTDTCTLTSGVPSLSNLNISEHDNRWYNITGLVTDESPGGLTVYFGGQPVSLAGLSTTVNSDGTFSLWVQLNGTSSDEGTAHINVSDWWGQAATTGTLNVHQTGV